MRIGVLGTGMVGRALAGKLRELGHDLVVGSRVAGDDAQPFAEAAAHGELIVNATNGAYALDALAQAGAENLRGKILVDVTNPLDFSKGFPPSLFVSNTDSLGEQIQKELPDTKVVKSFNTINCEVMVDAARAGGESDLFVSGNDPEAKATVSRFAREQFGWKNVVDLGDITTSRGTEAYLLLWIRLYGALKTGDFNIKIVKK
jgi:8-hydroxy-5-deazaflavin:NADPH oxidoreductase